MEGDPENGSNISNDSLRQQLESFGEHVGPITNSTRPVLLRKLIKYRSGGDQADSPKNDGHKEAGIVEPVAETIGESALSDNKRDDGHGDTAEPSLPAEKQTFYGVQLPEEARKGEDINCVVTSKVEVLKLIKKYVGSRFKAFMSQEEARCFAEQIPAQSLPQISINSPQKEQHGVVTETAVYRGPTMQELTQFKKLIEASDIPRVKQLIWSNPRYLISSGDTPVILQPGYRYNALHITAMKNRPDICRLVLESLEDSRLLQLLYPDDTEQVRSQRINYITDLYLNTPDKGNCESALHFACKFGHVDVVDILTAHPRIDKHRKNKYGETPEEVVCNRMKNPSPDVENRIRNLLQDRYFVPLLRADDNSCPAKVEKPWSPGEVRMRTLCNRIIDNSPKHVPLTVKAYAGPMSPVQAQKFRKIWLTPPPPGTPKVKKYVEIRRGDNEKGLERIGRFLAHDMHIPWTEYWEFLGCFADLSGSEGLQMLEHYLEQQRDILEEKLRHEEHMQEIVDQLSRFHLDDSIHDDSIQDDNIQSISHQKEADNNAPSPSSEDAPPNSSSDKSKAPPDDTSSSDISKAPPGDKAPTSVESHSPHSKNPTCLDKPHTSHGNATDKMNTKHNNDGKNNIKHVFIKDRTSTPVKFASNGSCDQCQGEPSTPVSQNQSGEGSNSLPNCSIDTTVEAGQGDNFITYLKKFGQTFISKITSSAVKNNTLPEETFDEEDGRISPADSATSFVTAEDDLDLEYVDMLDDLDLGQAKEPCSPVFLLGTKPSKTDADVLHALEMVPVSPVNYPHLSRWKQLVTSYSEKARHCWGTPPTQGRRQVQSADKHIQPSTRVFPESPEWPCGIRSPDSSSSFSDISLDNIRADLSSRFSNL